MDLRNPDDPFDFAAPIALGVIGLGMAGAVMVNAAAAHQSLVHIGPSTSERCSCPKISDASKREPQFRIRPRSNLSGDNARCRKRGP